MTEGGLGLRERKRLATKRSIQRAVLSLSIEHGFDRVTIEEVSREADIAPRTFFNYFPTKEAALVGDVPRELDSAAVERFIAGGPSGSFFVDFGEMMISHLDGVQFDREIYELRHCFFRDNPDLARTHFALMKHFESGLVEIVLSRIARDQATQPSIDLADAPMLTAIAMGAVRAAWMNWASDTAHNQEISAHVRASCANVYRVVSEYR